MMYLAGDGGWSVNNLHYQQGFCRTCGRCLDCGGCNHGTIRPGTIMCQNINDGWISTDSTGQYVFFPGAIFDQDIDESDIDESKIDAD